MASPPAARRSFFDAWSSFYDLPLVQRVVYRPLQDAVVATLRPLAPSRVLDVGCGTGLLTTRMAEEFPGAAVVGCDYSAGMLRQAAARGRRVAWARGDALRLPFRDGSFGAVTSTESFHWFPDHRGALAELFRVTAPGGRLLVAMVNPPAEFVGRVALTGSRLAGQPFYWPTSARMREQVEAAGFRVESQRRIPRLTAAVLFPPVLTVAVHPG